MKLFIALCLAPFCLFAQQRIFVVGGVGAANLIEDYGKHHMVGHQIGIRIDDTYEGGIHGVIGVNWKRKGNESKDGSLHVNFINFETGLEVSAPNGLTIGAGGYFGANVQTTVTEQRDGQTVEYRDSRKGRRYTSQPGYYFSIGHVGERITVLAQYDRGVTNLSTGSDHVSPQSIALTFGYKIFQE